MATEADRADKARQMQELGFSSEAISDLLGVATSDELEVDLADNEVLEAFQDEGFGLQVDEELDLELVESHTRVEWDPATNEPVRAQHVYVDEVSCVGCTLCAGIAQSTFFMEAEQGRARVFEQWGDDDETIEIAIDTCPVNCIHYVPYEELKRLEVERRGQNINHKARLVGGAGALPQNKYGGGSEFTGHQVISGNMGLCCNNCPGRGCAECPMFGIGLNPAFQKKEERRKQKKLERERKRAMESKAKRAEL